MRFHILSRVLRNHDRSILSLVSEHLWKKSALSPSIYAIAPNAQGILGQIRFFSDLPPHTELQMPALSPTMSQGNIAIWKVKEGQEVTAGDVLAEVETDKATMDWENQDDGFIAKILVKEGEKDISVGTPLIVLVDDEESVPAFSDYSPSETPKAAAPAEKASEDAPASSASADSGSKESKASGSVETYEVNLRIGPAAASLLRQYKLQARQIKPSGPHNMVTKGDVLAAIERGIKPSNAEPSSPAEKQEAAQKVSQQPQPSHEPEAKQAPAQGAEAASAPQRPRKRGQGESYTDIPNSQIRKIIAKRLLESKMEVPHYYLRGHADLRTVNSLRQILKEQGSKVSVNDFIVRATALALSDVPRANSQWDAKSGEVVPCQSVDISIAVATDKGLITPIVKDANKKSLTQISAEVRELAAKARANKLQPHEFTGGSFTISNLGMFNVDRFCAIINPPQAGILAIGGTQQQVSLVDGQPMATPSMTVTLSADERIVDGDLAAAFLDAFAKNISNPVKLLSV